MHRIRETKWPVRLSVRTPGFHPGKGGSIPPRATKNFKQWSVRLGVRTPGFHPGNRGSIPLRTTIKTLTKLFKLRNNGKS